MTHVLAKIAKILNLQAHTIERWGFVYRDEQTPWLTLCVRVKSDKANDLYNSKDSLCFFGKFFTRDQQATAEDNVAIIWSSCSTIAAVKHIADTLHGILGYAGNSSSIGVRVKKENVAAARHALMRPNPRITSSNRNVDAVQASIYHYVQVVRRIFKRRPNLMPMYHDIHSYFDQGFSSSGPVNNLRKAVHDAGGCNWESPTRLSHLTGCALDLCDNSADWSHKVRNLLRQMVWKEKSFQKRQDTCEIEPSSIDYEATVALLRTAQKKNKKQYSC